MVAHSPLVTATLQAAGLSLLSNVLGQLIGCYQAGVPLALNFHELFSFAFFSILSSPPNYLWQTWLEATFPGYTKSLSRDEKKEIADEAVAGTKTGIDAGDVELRSRNKGTDGKDGKDNSSPNSRSQDSPTRSLNIRNTLTKFLLDQSFGAAFNTVAFIMGIAMLRGQSFGSAVQQVREGFWPLVRAGQKLWPMVSLVSLTLVPVERRMVFGGCVGVGWGIFLSLMSGGKKGLKRE